MISSFIPGVKKARMCILYNHIASNKYIQIDSNDSSVFIPMQDLCRGLKSKSKCCMLVEKYQPAVLVWLADVLKDSIVLY